MTEPRVPRSISAMVSKGASIMPPIKGGKPISREIREHSAADFLEFGVLPAGFPDSFKELLESRVLAHRHEALGKPLIRGQRRDISQRLEGAPGARYKVPQAEIELVFHKEVVLIRLHVLFFHEILEVWPCPAGRARATYSLYSRGFHRPCRRKTWGLSLESWS